MNTVPCTLNTNYISKMSSSVPKLQLPQICKRLGSWAPHLLHGRNIGRELLNFRFGPAEKENKKNLLDFPAPS